MSSDITIEEKIRKFYVAETGEWLVEKGKVKEARLLKEACEELENLRKILKAKDERIFELHRERNDYRNEVNEEFEKEKEEFDRKRWANNRRIRDIKNKLEDVTRDMSFLDNF